VFYFSLLLYIKVCYTATSLVISRVYFHLVLMQSILDNANSIMYGMSASNMHKLQSAQNSLTRVVLPSLRHLSASGRIIYLHWLPVHYRIEFKIATLTYKTLATCQPSYLYNLLELQPSRALRSSTQQLLQVTIYVYRFW